MLGNPYLHVTDATSGKADVPRSGPNRAGIVAIKAAFPDPARLQVFDRRSRAQGASSPLAEYSQDASR
jgi:hypothetical protein